MIVGHKENFVTNRGESLINGIKWRMIVEINIEKFVT